MPNKKRPAEVQENTAIKKNRTNNKAGSVESREKEMMKQKKVIDEERRALEEEKAAWAIMKERIESDISTVADYIELNVRGSVRWICKADILRFGDSYFKGMLSFNPFHNGQYMINR